MGKAHGESFTVGITTASLGCGGGGRFGRGRDGLGDEDDGMGDGKRTRDPVSPGYLKRELISGNLADKNAVLKLHIQ